MPASKIEYFKRLMVKPCTLQTYEEFAEDSRLVNIVECARIVCTVVVRKVVENESHLLFTPTTVTAAQEDERHVLKDSQET